MYKHTEKTVSPPVVGVNMDPLAVAFRKTLKWALDESELTFQDVVDGGGYTDVDEFTQMFYIDGPTFMDFYHVAVALRVSIDRLKDLVQESSRTPLWGGDAK